MARYPQIENALRHVERILRERSYSARTRTTYLGIVRRYLYFHRQAPPASLGRGHIERYFWCLVKERRLAASSRNQALAAISFHHREILGSDVGDRIARAKSSEPAPVVFTDDEARRVIGELPGRYRLIGAMLYGTGVRIAECLALRVKDLDFEYGQITVRRGKGGSDRFTILPTTLRVALREQVERVAKLHRKDRKCGHGWAPLPDALDRKDPEAGYKLGWQYVHPSTRITQDAATGRTGRVSLHPSAVQRKIKQAIQAARIIKKATTHTFRHTFATQLLRDGYDIRTVQELMGHKDVRVTMRYLHVVQQTGLAVRSPLDRPTHHD